MSSIRALVLINIGLCSHALRSPERLAITRRSAAASLLSLPAVLRPRSARAGPFDDPGPVKELGNLRGIKDRLDDLSKQLDDGYFGNSEEDSIVVLRTSAVYFNGASQSMAKTVDAMPLLTSEERQTALDLSKKFGEEVLGLTSACRERSSKAQLAATTSASGTLSDYLAVAATHYSVPDFKIKPYSASSTEFAAQYFGFFSCEGQGLERVKGSNTCKDPPKKQQQRKDSNAFKLDFDFLTGKAL